MAKKKTRIKKVPLGNPLPPASDAEFTPDAMRQWGYNEALVHAEKYGNDILNAMLSAEVEEIVTNA